MINKKILLISTYPIIGAQTGGPLRVKALYENYQKVFTQVRHTAVFSRYHHPSDYSPNDIAIKGDLAEKTRHEPVTSDYLIGKAIYEDALLRKEVAEMLLNYKPDIIEIEQVFPYLGLRTLIKELGLKIKIVHSSHNIEYKMKEEILVRYNFPEEKIKSVVTEIRLAEEHLAREADLVAAVTKEDGDEILGMGAKSYVLARNGVFDKMATEKALSKWQKYFTEQNIDDYAVFVASAHPPNMEGYKRMIGTAMGYLRPGQSIVLAGDVGTNIKNGLDEYSVADVTCHRRTLFLGRLSDDDLSAVISLSKAMLLPITEGGGSNLKTAEAIISTKPVIATTKAMRSFQEYIALPTVSIADTGAGFKSSIAKILSNEPARLNHDEIKLTRLLLWSNCLKDLTKAVEKL